MNYIHVNFQDLQQSGLGFGFRYKNNGDGEDLEERRDDGDDDSQHTAN